MHMDLVRSHSARLDLLGRTLAHYQINAAIGAGGMGEVYRATDTKLGRDVALKILPPDFACDPERLARFQNEARAVAALNHPNVVTLYSVEESAGVHFLTMELIEGQPLNRVIPASGLPLERITEIAGSLADALAAAHGKGIIHRDLKPANIMITTEGRVKVLDFGLAKEVRTESAGDATMTSDQTKAGMVMGTPAYMSPEQISGRPLDPRTDIFSLGIVLHEMCTGRRPFGGASAAELISSILRDHPTLVTDVRADLPADLARVIRRCLEKDPSRRLQTARDVSNEFRDMTRTASHATPLPATAPHATPQASSATQAASSPGSGSARAIEAFWVAVLPFKYKAANDDLSALAEGLTEDIITGMSRFPYLRVVASSSSSRYDHDSVDAKAAGKELGARYVIEGNLRKSGVTLRVAVQLVDSNSGAHLWAETYERAFRPEAAFQIQDDLVPRIVSTIADAHGILPHTLSEAIRDKAPEQLTPYEAVLRSFIYAERITPEDHAAARTALERAVQLAPSYAYAWAMLSIIYSDVYAQGFGADPDPLGRALMAARKAVELEPSNHRTFHALAVVQFHRKELEAFRTAAERTIQLNPMDGCSLADLGSHMAFAGDWDRGCALVERAIGLNPHHPGWYWFPLFFNAYRKSDYAGALDFALKINLAGLASTHMVLAAAYGQLGKRDAAGQALRELLALVPSFASIARPLLAMRMWFDLELAEHLIDGLRKAGLDIPAKEESAIVPPDVPALTHTVSGAARVEEGFWVAVLPFRGANGDAELEALADGLSEDITAGLSRFPYLQVIAHNSAMAYKGRAADIRTVGRELGARYVLEGSIRKRGRAMRINAQLMDSASGTQLWSEAYDREISDAGTFQIQDDLTDHIVTSVADGYGVLVRSMAAPTRDRKVEELTASELVLRYYAFMQQVNPQEHAALRAGLEHALQREPHHATAWACLSNLYQLERYDRINPQEKSLERARDAAWRAVKIDPACQMGWMQLADVHFFNRDFVSFRETAERALSLNPRDGTTWAYVAIMIAFSGDWERGIALAQRTIDLNRHHPGWYHNIFFHYHYRKGDYEAALAAAKRINMPEYHWMQLMIAAACGMLGRMEEAAAAIASLRKYNPTFLDLKQVQEDIEMWDPVQGDVERFLQGLQKAGLNYASPESAAARN